jgi:predicted phosphoribosyltransferase
LILIKAQPIDAPLHGWMNLSAAYLNRAEAGRRLGERLAVRRIGRPVVLALPRGGVPVARQVAKALDAPLDILLVRKLGAPGSPEVALGALAEGLERPVLNSDVVEASGAGPDYIAAAVAEAGREIARRAGRFAKVRRPVEPAGRTVIVVDDGLATGATARAAAMALRQRGAAKVLLAVPVAPSDSQLELADAFDEVVCLLSPRAFPGVGAFYADFHQLSDDEVEAELRLAAGAGVETAAPV